MSERPFDERCAAAGLRYVDQLEAVLRRYPLMTLVIVADAILKRISPWRQRAGDAVDFCMWSQPSKSASQPDSLPDREEMGRRLVAGGAGC